MSLTDDNRNLTFGQEFPVIISVDQYEQVTGKNLLTILGTESTSEAEDFIKKAEDNLYYCLIYQLGGKEFKDQMIINNYAYLADALKACIVAQIDYQIDAGGDYGTSDGSTMTSEGELKLTDNKQLEGKIVAPKVVKILKGVRPNLLLGMDL